MSKKDDDNEGVIHNIDVEALPSSHVPFSTKVLSLRENPYVWLNVFSLDLRSLALFRIIIGLVIMLDTILRTRNIFSHYAQLGVWPGTEAIGNLNGHSFSFMFANGNMPFLVLFFIFTTVVAFVFTIGYKTRISTFLLWILVLSIHNRNILVLSSGDDFIRLMLFWGIFLPLGDKYSVDHAINASSILTEKVHLSVKSAAFVVQVMCVYWVGYWLKTGVEWEENTAMYYIFSMDQYTTSFGYFVLRFPRFLKLLTMLYLLLELAMPIALMVPIYQGVVRTYACLVSIAFYLFLNICLELGLFTYAPIIAGIALLPSYFWDSMFVTISGYVGPVATNKYFSMGGSLTLYYAPGPYSQATKFLLQLGNSFLGLNSPILAADDRQNHNFEGMGENESSFLNGDADIARTLSENRAQWLVVDGAGRRHMRHKGVIALLAEVPLLTPVIPLLHKAEKAIAFIYEAYNKIYNLFGIQHSFSSMGPVNAAQQALPPRRPRRRVAVSDVVVVALMLYMVWWSTGVVSSEYGVPKGMQWLGMLLRIDQSWSTFAPYPQKDDGWFVISAKLANGKEIDLWKPGGGHLTYDKPKSIMHTFRDHRWQRFMMNLWSSAHQDKRLFYGRYICRQWNWYGRGDRDKEYLLKQFRIIYMREITLPNYRVKGPEPMTMWEHQC